MTAEQLIELLQQMPPKAQIVRSNIYTEKFERLQAVTVLKLAFSNNGSICESYAYPPLEVCSELAFDAIILDFEDL